MRRVNGDTCQRCFSEVNAIPLRRLQTSREMWRLRGAQGFAFGVALGDAAVEVGARLGLVCVARMMAMVWMALLTWRFEPCWV